MSTQKDNTAAVDPTKVTQDQQDNQPQGSESSQGSEADSLKQDTGLNQQQPSDSGKKLPATGEMPNDQAAADGEQPKAGESGTDPDPAEKDGEQQGADNGDEQQGQPKAPESEKSPGKEPEQAPAKPRGRPPKTTEVKKSGEPESKAKANDAGNTPPLTTQPPVTSTDNGPDDAVKAAGDEPKASPKNYVEVRNDGFMVRMEPLTGTRLEPGVTVKIPVTPHTRAQVVSNITQLNRFKNNLEILP